MPVPTDNEITPESILTTLRETLGWDFVGFVIRRVFCNAEAGSERFEHLAHYDHVRMSTEATIS
jgi:hypothetical protein